jgi:hypothetical protein
MRYCRDKEADAPCVEKLLVKKVHRLQWTMTTPASSYGEYSVDIAIIELLDDTETLVYCDVSPTT